MTSHIQAKFIKSLSQKKHRELTKKFLVEGGKGVLELLISDFEIDFVYSTLEFKTKHAKILEKKNVKVQVVEASELAHLGSFEHNDSALAVAHQKETNINNIKKYGKSR